MKKKNGTEQFWSQKIPKKVIFTGNVFSTGGILLYQATPLFVSCFQSIWSEVLSRIGKSRTRKGVKRDEKYVEIDDICGAPGFDRIGTNGQRIGSRECVGRAGAGIRGCECQPKRANAWRFSECWRLRSGASVWRAERKAERRLAGIGLESCECSWSSRRAGCQWQRASQQRNHHAGGVD